MRPAKKQSPYLDDHFSLWEEAHFQRMSEEAEIDALLERLFPEERSADR